jgi:nucleotide-binding universal stress UspA family protein
VRCGDPAKTIVAQAEGADLIVMSTHGYGPVRSLLLGSVTAKVLHDSDRPVWTCRPSSEAGHDPSTIRQVACAVAFRTNGANAIRWAAEFAAAYRAKLTLAHAIQPAPREMPEQSARSWHGEARWAAGEQLRALLSDLHVEAETLVIEGEPPEALAAAAKEHNFDLMVIGRSHPTTRIGRLGSHSYRIICQAPCPVVSL